jgi:hypothetical protein
MFIQALVAEPSVETLDIGVLVRLAGLNQFQRRTGAERPVGHGVANKLRAVVTSNNQRLSLLGADLIEYLRQVTAAHAALRYDGGRLVSGIDNDRQTL